LFSLIFVCVFSHEEYLDSKFVFFAYSFVSIVAPCLFRHSHGWRIMIFHLWVFIGWPLGTWWSVVFWGLVAASQCIRNGFAGTPYLLLVLWLCFVWQHMVISEWCLDDVQLTEVHLYHSAIPFQPLSCVDHYINPVKNLLTVFIFLLLCNLRLHQWIYCGFIIRESFAHDSQLFRSNTIIFQTFYLHRIVWCAAVFGLSDHGFPPKHPATHFAFVVLGFWWSAWSGGNSSSQASSGS
jgi:hypothetical protein